MAVDRHALDIAHRAERKQKSRMADLASRASRGIRTSKNLKALSIERPRVLQRMEKAARKQLSPAKRKTFRGLAQFRGKVGSSPVNLPPAKLLAGAVKRFRRLGESSLSTVTEDVWSYVRLVASGVVPLPADISRKTFDRMARSTPSVETEAARDVVAFKDLTPHEQREVRKARAKKKEKQAASGPTQPQPRRFKIVDLTRTPIELGTPDERAIKALGEWFSEDDPAAASTSYAPTSKRGPVKFVVPDTWQARPPTAAATAATTPTASSRPSKSRDDTARDGVKKNPGPPGRRRWAWVAHNMLGRGFPIRQPGNEPLEAKPGHSVRPGKRRRTGEGRKALLMAGVEPNPGPKAKKSAAAPPSPKPSGVACLAQDGERVNAAFIVVAKKAREHRVGMDIQTFDGRKFWPICPNCVCGLTSVQPPLTEGGYYTGLHNTKFRAAMPRGSTIVSDFVAYAKATGMETVAPIATQPAVDLSILDGPTPAAQAAPVRPAAPSPPHGDAPPAVSAPSPAPSPVPAAAAAAPVQTTVKEGASPSHSVQSSAASSPALAMSSPKVAQSTVKEGVSPSHSGATERLAIPDKKPEGVQATPTGPPPAATGLPPVPTADDIPAFVAPSALHAGCDYIQITTGINPLHLFRFWSSVYRDVRSICRSFAAPAGDEAPLRLGAISGLSESLADAETARLGRARDSLAGAAAAAALARVRGPPVAAPPLPPVPPVGPPVPPAPPPPPPPAPHPPGGPAPGAGPAAPAPAPAAPAAAAPPAPPLPVLDGSRGDQIARLFAEEQGFPWYLPRDIQTGHFVEPIGPEQRVALDRGVRVIRAPHRLERITVRPARGVSWLACGLLYSSVALFYAAISNPTCMEAWMAFGFMSTTTFVINSRIAAQYWREFWEGPRTCVYSPHLLSNVCAEFSNGTGAEAVAKSARSKMLRCAAMPITDVQSTQVRCGTEHIAKLFVPTLPFFGDQAQGAAAPPWAMAPIH